MGRYSCAIGGCYEKSYRRSDGVRFFHIKHVPEPMKTAWKRKVLATRKDLSRLKDVNDHAICSRHFVNGEKSRIPTIIPKMSKGVVVWPSTNGNKPRMDRRRSLPATLPTAPCNSCRSDDSQTNAHKINQENTAPSSSNTPIVREELNEHPEVDIKLTEKPTHVSKWEIGTQRLQQSMTEPMDEIIQDIINKQDEAIKTLPSDVRKIYEEIFEEPSVNQPSKLSQKLHALQQQSEEDNLGKYQSRQSVTTKIIRRLHEQLKAERHLINELRRKCTTQPFGIHRFKEDPMDFAFYTGLPDYLTFLTLLDFLQPERNNLISLYYIPKSHNESYVNTKGRGCILSAEEQLFLVLCKFRQGYLRKDIAHRFDISESTVTDILTKWINQMAHMFKQMPIWPSREFVDSNTPQAFKDLGFERTRCIIDCTEIFIDKPSNLVLQSVTFSSYKNHNTAKGLVAILPHGPICFTSDLYAGSATDYDITATCGLLDLLESGDHVMADKGFEVQDLFDSKGVRVNHPPVLRGITRMSLEQETTTRRIARLRIHVERSIGRVKHFRILNSIPFGLCRLLNDIWITCCHLTNFLPPLINEE